MHLDLYLWDTLLKNLHFTTAELTWLCLCCRRSLWCPPVRLCWRCSRWDPLNCDSGTWWPVCGLWRGCRSCRCKNTQRRIRQHSRRLKQRSARRSVKLPSVRLKQEQCTRSFSRWCMMVYASIELHQIICTNYCGNTHLGLGFVIKKCFWKKPPFW